jgi:hypothetical protein
MTAPAPPRVVTRASLKLDRRIGLGGQGSVHHVDNRRINAADEAWTVAYKEYNAIVLPALNGAALSSMVALPETLDGAEGRWLCEKTAWPAAVVEDRGRITGFLMREAPVRFRIRIPALTSHSLGTVRPATVDYLLNDDAYAASIGLTVTDKDRALLLADLADALSRLHRLGIAVGDLSPKNLLFSTGARPECLLLDCDTMRLRGASVLRQTDTPGWQLPVGEEKATCEGDVYKFGLLAVRLFARNQTTTSTGALGGYDARLADLARASLDPDRRRRPTPSAWAAALKAAALKTAGPKPSTAAASAAATPGRPARGLAFGHVREALQLLVGAGLIVAYNWLPWTTSPQDGSSLTFHTADTLSSSLFARAFWIAVVGMILTLDVGYVGNAIATLLGLASVCCLAAGYVRLEDEGGVFPARPSPGFELCFGASLAVLVIGAWWCITAHRARKP